MLNKNGLFLAAFLLLIFKCATQKILENNVRISSPEEGTNYSMIIYDYGIVNPSWAAYNLKNKLFCCGKTEQPIESAYNKKRKFEIENNGKEILEIDKIEINSNQKLMSPSLTTPNKLAINSNTKDYFVVEYNCDNAKILQENFDGWSGILISLHLKNNQMIEFSYTKICTLENKDSIDWSLFVLFMIAAIILVTATQQNHSLNVDPGAHEDHIKSVHYIFFAFLSSGALITFYFFSEISGTILSILFSISAVTVLTILISEFIESYTSDFKICRRKYDFKYFGKINFPEIFAFFLSILLVYCWYVTRYWIFNNLISVGIVIIVLKAVKIQSFKTITILLSACFCYDIFWVFISKLIFGQSVMMSNVSHIDIPIKLEWPYFMSMPINMCSLLGLGDIVFPGFLVTYNYRYGLQKKTLSYFWISISSYAVSLFVCGIVMFKTASEQPALIYIVPVMIMSTIYVSVKRGEFKEMWEGIEDEYQYHNMKDYFNRSDSVQIRINNYEEI